MQGGSGLRLRLQGELDVVIVADYVLAQEVHGLAEPAAGRHRVLGRVHVHALAAAPEDEHLRAQLDREAFAKQIAKTRAGVGPLLSRELIDASYTTTVPGAPEGQYVVLHYGVSFANRQEEVETIVLAFAKGYWRVSGYYIK